LTATLSVVGLKPAAWLAILGALLEISGFSLVAVELARAQRRELGTAGPFQFLLVFGTWARVRWRRLLGKSTVHEGSANLSGTISLSARGSVRLGTESKDLAERVPILEENFKQLDNEVTDHRRELDERIGKEAEAQQTALAEFRDQVQARVDEERAAFASSAMLQWWGIGLFVLGACASAAANIAGAS
jgi:hypothetical protein